MVKKKEYGYGKKGAESEGKFKRIRRKKDEGENLLLFML